MMRYSWLSVLILLAGTGVTPAQMPAQVPVHHQGAPQPEPPWYDGVPAELRAKANEMFEQALALHEQLLRDQAVVKYEEALAHWDNPAIRWNLTLALKDMGQYLAAYHQLEKVLMWKLDSIPEEVRSDMRALHEKLLREHLAAIEVHSDEAGAEIALDGQPWFRGPGTQRKVIVPGEHVITANKPGYFPVVKAFNLSAGKQGTVILAMDEDGIYEKRRWPRWKPLAVIGSGAAIGLVGTGLLALSGMHLEEARSDFGMTCNGTVCQPTRTNSYGRAVLENRLAIASFVIGGSLVATGLALGYINRPRSYRTQPGEAPAFELVPLITSDTAGMAARMDF